MRMLRSRALLVALGALVVTNAALRPDLSTYRASGPNARVNAVRMEIARSELPVFDGKPYSPNIGTQTALRCAAVTSGSLLATSVTLPELSEFTSFANLDGGLSVRPLLTLLSMAALVVASWSTYGVDMHPITARARGLEPPPGV